MADQNIEGRCDEFDSDGNELGGVLLCLAQRSTNGVNPLVTEASDFNIRTDLDGLRCQSSRNIGLQLLQDERVQLILDLRDAEYCVALADGKLECVVGVAELLVEGPCDLLVEFEELCLALLRYCTCACGELSR